MKILMTVGCGTKPRTITWPDACRAPAVGEYIRTEHDELVCVNAVTWGLGGEEPPTAVMNVSFA